MQCLRKGEPQDGLQWTHNPYALSLLFLFLFSILIFIKRSRKHRHGDISRSQPKHLPSPSPRLPLIGHLHLLTDMPHHTLANLACQLGPIFHLQLGQVPTVVISSPKLARLVLKTHDRVFANRPQLIAAQYLSFGCSDVTFSSYGPYWRQARKICVTELLSPKRVGSFQLVREEEMARLLGVLRSLSGLEVDMSKVFFGLANDVLCRVAFGKRFITESSEEGEKNHLVRVLTEAQDLLAGFSMGDFFPRWGWVNWVTGLERRLQNNLVSLRGVCDEIIGEHVKKRERRIMSIDADDDREDLLDVLMSIQQEDLEVPITDDNLKALVLIVISTQDMFVAGTDTTAATLEWTMTELARNPRVMKKAQEEVRRNAPTSDKLWERHLHELHYLKAVIKETMRLHPPVPLLVPRESMDRCMLDGYEVAARTRVLINAYALGRDGESWNQPLEFRPERFEGSNIDVKDQDFRFLPFGGGRRGCPGFAFGLITVETSLAKLLYHFNWALPPGVKEDDMDLSEIFGLATRKKMPLVLVPTVCQHQEF
ncbi:hypothetical protein BT93_H3423 [Corymbia citriodora subsp. variegata]|nr:hypothetical protein BT93_H3423 [Corymbia citriodora subsp. variegata]